MRCRMPEFNPWEDCDYILSYQNLQVFQLVQYSPTFARIHKSVAAGEQQLPHVICEEIFDHCISKDPKQSGVIVCLLSWLCACALSWFACRDLVQIT